MCATLCTGPPHILEPYFRGNHDRKKWYKLNRYNPRAQIRYIEEGNELQVCYDVPVIFGSNCIQRTNNSLRGNKELIVLLLQAFYILIWADRICIV